MGSLLDKHKVAGACATAFGKSLTDLLLLLHAYKRHNENAVLEIEGKWLCWPEAKVTGLS